MDINFSGSPKGSPVTLPFPVDLQMMYSIVIFLIQILPLTWVVAHTTINDAYFVGMWLNSIIQYF